MINIVKRIWRFDIDTYTHKILSSQDFANALKGEKLIYALVIIDIFDALVRKYHIDEVLTNIL